MAGKRNNKNGRGGRGGRGGSGRGNVNVKEVTVRDSVKNQSNGGEEFQPVEGRQHGVTQLPEAGSTASSPGANGAVRQGDLKEEITIGNSIRYQNGCGLGLRLVEEQQHSANQLPVAVTTAISAGGNEFGRTREDTLTDGPIPDVQTLRTLEQQDSKEGRIVLMKRHEDRWGKPADRLVQLWANCFPIKYNSEKTLFQYNFQIEVEKTAKGKGWLRKTPLKKSQRFLLWEKMFSDNPSRFTREVAVFDGDTVFSSDKLPTEQFKLELCDASHIVTTQLVNEYKYSLLNDYLNGVLEKNPRDLLQGFDAIMKENMSRNGIYCRVTAFTDFQQSLKFTSDSLALFLDTSALPFCMPMPVIDFLKENVSGFRGANDVSRLRREVEIALKGLKVTVSHRTTNMKFKVKGLTKEITGDLSFTWEDYYGKVPPKKVKVVDYFMQKYQKNIVHTDIPCLELGKKRVAVPMEFCVVTDGQWYRGKLDNEPAKSLRDLYVVPPAVKKNMICETVRSGYGPCGVQVCQDFGFEVDTNMTRVTAHVLEPPTVKLGNGATADFDQDKLKWNFFTKSLVKGVEIQRWALIDFSDGMLKKKNFIDQLMKQCRSLGVLMEEPLATPSTNMDQFQSIENVREQLREVTHQAIYKKQGQLQLIVCALNPKRSAYDLLKLVSEVETGVLTQCFLAKNANKDKNDRFFANLTLKMNAKLGGSNFELVELLPGLKKEDHVMLIGAAVNHPASLNATSQSIAAVVATVNWPAVNRYAARLSLQEPFKEQIVEFGLMCLDLLKTYACLNRVKPKKIVIFRDGVIDDGQFDMVLNEELSRLKSAIYEEHYKPEITLIVAHKRNPTRLFLENEVDRPLNVPLGTVVDSKITHPSESEFYLCSHFDSIGTSRSTHYQVFFGKDHFSSNELQKLIYDLCFTFARCTEPVSVVPPVYYAHLAVQRARRHHNAALKVQPSGSSSPSSLSSLSSTCSSTDFDNNFVIVHPNLQDSMYFV